MTIFYDPAGAWINATITTRRERKPVLYWWFDGGRIVWIWLKE